MTVAELKAKSIELAVPHSFYSINGNLTGDTYILNFVHTYWEYYYFDEKGRVTGYKRFESESDACIYLYQKLEKRMKYYHPRPAFDRRRAPVL